VLTEQRGQTISGRITTERLNGVSDVGLVLQQAGCG
jgi:hypothetical protein